MAREKFAGGGIAGCSGEPRVDPHVLDVFVAHPILHKGDVGLGVEEVGANRVLEAVELVLLRRKAGRFRIDIHEIPEGGAVHRDVAVGDKEVR